MAGKKKGLAHGKPAGLGNLVAYSPGSIVSSEIASAKGGTVTLFAFDKGQGLSEHTAPFDAIIHVLDGEALVTVLGSEQNVKKGEIIILPANKPHAVRAARRFKMMLVMVK